MGMGMGLAAFLGQKGRSGAALLPQLRGRRELAHPDFPNPAGKIPELPAPALNPPEELFEDFSLMNFSWWLSVDLSRNIFIFGAISGIFPTFSELLHWPSHISIPKTCPEMPQIHPEKSTFCQEIHQDPSFCVQNNKPASGQCCTASFWVENTSNKEDFNHFFSLQEVWAKGKGKRDWEWGILWEFSFQNSFTFLPLTHFVMRKIPFQLSQEMGVFFLLTLLGRMKFLPKGRTFNGITAKIPNPEEQEAGRALFPQSHTTAQVSRNFSNDFPILK